MTIFVESGERMYIGEHWSGGIKYFAKNFCRPEQCTPTYTRTPGSRFFDFGGPFDCIACHSGRIKGQILCTYRMIMYICNRLVVHSAMVIAMQWKLSISKIHLLNFGVH